MAGLLEGRIGFNMVVGHDRGRARMLACVAEGAKPRAGNRSKANGLEAVRLLRETG